MGINNLDYNINKLKRNICLSIGNTALGFTMFGTFLQANGITGKDIKTLTICGAFGATIGYKFAYDYHKYAVYLKEKELEKKRG